MNVTRIATIASVVLLSFTPAAFAQSEANRTTITETPKVTPVGQRGVLLLDAESTYGGVQKIIAAAAAQMPEEKYAFKPVSDVRTFGQIVGHVADAQYLFCSIVRGEKAATRNIEKSATTKAELIGALEESFRYCQATYAQLSEAAAAEPVRFMGGDKPRLGVLSTNSIHAIEHYGNLVTYLRINGLVPPTSQPDFLQSLRKK